MMEEKKIHAYCFSGLGADFRIFRQLQIPGVELHPITWEMPADGDSMHDFATKLSAQIQHENPVLIGVSYGGMLVSELVDIINHRFAFVVSSCTSRKQIAPWLRAAGKMRLHELIPYHRFLQSDKFNRFIFDPKSRNEELYLKRLMLKENDIEFLRRSVRLIMQWERTISPDRIIHIHGSADKLLPVSARHVHHVVKGGGHFMIWNKAKEIAQIMSRYLHQS